MPTRSHTSRIRGKYIAIFLLACTLAFVLTYAGVDIYRHSKAIDVKPYVSAPQDTTTDGKLSEVKPPSPGPSQSTEATNPPTRRYSGSAPNIIEDYRPGFEHGVKTAQYQKYIVLHDTEVDASATAIANAWQSQGTFVAAHFIVQKDGTIVQVVPMDSIAHHAGFGDTGHNALYGVTDESRDDRRGTVPIGSWASDYGMNSYSIGIEMVHVSGTGYYPPEQLKAVDDLIAYIDSYYGFESQIIDHKAWRSGNSDTSPEFAGYLANYKDHRTHN